MNITQRLLYKLHFNYISTNDFIVKTYSILYFFIFKVKIIIIININFENYRMNVMNKCLNVVRSVDDQISKWIQKHYFGNDENNILFIIFITRLLDWIIQLIFTITFQIFRFVNVIAPLFGFIITYALLAIYSLTYSICRIIYKQYLNTYTNRRINYLTLFVIQIMLLFIIIMILNSGKIYLYFVQRIICNLY